MNSLLVTAPGRIRRRYVERGDSELLHALLRLRPAAEADQLSRTVLTGQKSVARRQHKLSVEIDELDTEITALLNQAAPALDRTKGFGVITAAQLLITAGKNSYRLHPEAALGALCGAGPIADSSGKTNRHRLNRGGHLQANSALRHQLGLTQAQIATALTINPAKVSLTEHGLAHDNECFRTYHQWPSQRI